MTTGRQANVTSVEALAAFRAALIAFAEQLEHGLTALELEGRRPLQWIEERALYWPAQERKASDRVAEAKIALARCEMTIDANEPKRCYDERKQLEKAKRRLEFCEDRVRSLSRWRQKIAKETQEFQTQIAKFRNWAETDVEAAPLALGKMIAALEKYATLAAPTGSASGAAAMAAAWSAAMPVDESPKKAIDAGDSLDEDVEDPSDLEPSDQEPAA